MEALKGGARPAFLDRVRRRLIATYPHFLPCFPEDIQTRITGHMLERAAAWGLRQQASLWTWCSLMVSVAPNFDEEPTIRARLDQDRDELDHALAGLAKSMPPHIQRAAWRIGSRLRRRWRHGLGERGQRQRGHGQKSGAPRLSRPTKDRPVIPLLRSPRGESTANAED